VFILSGLDSCCFGVLIGLSSSESGNLSIKLLFGPESGLDLFTAQKLLFGIECINLPDLFSFRSIGYRYGLCLKVILDLLCLDSVKSLLLSSGLLDSNALSFKLLSSDAGILSF